jgi:hypothetical protein
MPKIKVFLTFDYELPLGGVAKSYKHCLFDPTEKLLEIADELNIPIVFFADILCAIKFKTWDHDGFFVPFKNQISDALKRGHDIQLHLHPHWLHTELENGKFLISEKYSLSDFASDSYPENIEGIIESGYNALSEICREVDPDYKCTAFRAGGYSLQPKTAEILSSLYHNGIRFDSSISRGYYFKSDTSFVDYRKIVDQPNWILPFNGDLLSEAKAGILEIPIASKIKNIFELPTRFKLKLYKQRAVENRGIQLHTNHKTDLKDKIIQMFSSRMLTLDNHTYSDKYLMKILDNNVKRYKSSEVIMCSLIGHPKAMGDYAYTLMRNFVKNVKDKYGSSVEFCTYSQISKQQTESRLNK